MIAQKKARIQLIWEILFQVGLHLVVFIFYAFHREKGHVRSNIDLPEILFFLNYVIAAFSINYVLLPRFLYRQRYALFSLLLLIIVALVIVMEEGVIEQIFYPDTRGTRFPGIFNNLLGAMPTITILVGFKFAWDALHQRRKLKELEYSIKESQLQYLKSQINPHFLFNNLNNLYAYSLEKSPKTPEIILELSSVLRYMLYECHEETVPLEKEMEQLENFVKLSRLQIENRGTIEFNRPHQFDDYRIAPLILSVFIENAIKHSASSLNSGIIIKIDMKLQENGQFHFMCSNTFSENSNTNELTHGIGLENVRKRLELIYPEKHVLLLTTLENLFSVNLTIDLEAK